MATPATCRYDISAALSDLWEEKPTMQNATRYWFPAKRYGWGWGLPITWQGWLSVAVFLGLAIAGLLIFPLKMAPAAYIAYTAVLSGLFVAVAWLKGERPRWRWGGE
nr:hypothetical protein [uncultured Rhodopila sp.]